MDYSKNKFTKEEKFLIRKEAELVKHKYPGYIPIIIIAKSKDIKITKHKYLVGSDLTVAQFQQIVRKKLKNSIKETESIFMLACNTNTKNGVLLHVGSMMAQVYSDYFDKDTQMLFIELCKENTFG